MGKNPTAPDMPGLKHVDWKNQPGGKTGRQVVNARLNEEQAIKMRALGMSYRQIANQLGVTHTTARRYVVRALERHLKELEESVDEHIRIELMRLDAMFLSLQKKLAIGDTNAINSALRILERRAKMLGLDYGDRARDVDDDNVIDGVVEVYVPDNARNTDD